MDAKELRSRAKSLLTMVFLRIMKIDNPPGNPQIGLQDVDDFVDTMVDLVIAEIVENYQVDVPNTGYYGVIEKR